LTARSLPLAFAALWGATLAASPLPARAGATDNVVITRVSPDPPAMSGIVAFFVEISGTVGGEERSYLIPFMTKGQKKPEVGQACSLSWVRSDTGGITGYGASVEGGRWVNEFHCEAVR